MAFQTGIIGFARVPGAADPHKVYALGGGGRAIADPADLMKATGAKSIAEAWSLANVQEFTPSQAYAKGIRAAGIAAPSATVPKISPIAAQDTGRLDLGDGDDLPITVIPKRPLISDVLPEPTKPDITVPELAALGERFGVEGIGEVPTFRTGLDATQRRNIETLIKTKPQTQWSDKDWTDFRWATETEVPAITGNAVIDAYNKREDVRKTIAKAFPGQDPFKRGTAANTWLNDWWTRTGSAEMTEQVPLEEDIAVITGDDLVDYYNTRPDVTAAAEEAFPGQNPLQQGTEANEWLENWWTTTGQAEMADEAAKGTFTPSVPAEPTVPIEPTVPVVDGTLVDYYGTRQDVIDTITETYPGQDPFEEGTEANTWLNDWFERTGRAEMADEVSKGTYTPTVTPTPDAETIIPEGTPEQKSAFQSIIDKIKEMVGIKKEAFEVAAEELGLEEKSQKITDIQTTIQDRKEYYTGEKTRIANRLASAHVIDAEQAKLEGQRITEMTNLEIRQAIAQGNYDRAHQLAKDSAQDAYDAAELEIKALEVQGLIDKDEKDELMEMIQFRKDLLDDGFVPLTPEEAASMDSSQYITLPDGTSYLMLPEMSEDTIISGMTPDQMDAFLKLRTEATKDPDIKGFIDIRDAYDRLEASGKDPSAAGDLALIFNYMKMLDPASVVRESEFATAATSGSIPEIIWAKYNKILVGERLSEPMREDFMDRGNRLYQSRKRNYDKAVAFWRKEAELFGVPVDRIIRDYTTPAVGGISDIWGFSSVEGDTDSALLSIAGTEDGEKGGQCGRFVNSITELGVGDTFASKMAKMDKTIKTPEAGMVFTMPYKDTGHCGFIVSIDDKGIATVKDSNWLLDEKIKTHTIDTKKMTGFAYVNRLA